MEFILYLFKLLTFISLVLILLHLSVKLNQNKFTNISNKRYLKVLERINVSKDNSFVILKIGEEGCVMSITSSNTTKIKDLTKEEIKQIEEIKHNNK